jgi:hypothetical protein
VITETAALYPSLFLFCLSREVQGFRRPSGSALRGSSLSDTADGAECHRRAQLQSRVQDLVQERPDRRHQHLQRLRNCSAPLGRRSRDRRIRVNGSARLRARREPIVFRCFAGRPNSPAKLVPEVRSGWLISADTRFVPGGWHFTAILVSSSPRRGGNYETGERKESAEWISDPGEGHLKISRTRKFARARTWNDCQRNDRRQLESSAPIVFPKMHLMAIR